MTFLDIVRRVGAESLARCEGCSPMQHRREATEVLLILAKAPDLAEELIESIRSFYREPIFEKSTGNFLGFRGRVCLDHRTVGAHRAWCFDCGEWCYPTLPCERCQRNHPSSSIGR